MTRGLAVLRAPQSPEAHPAAYGLGRIFQAGPRQAGILLNLRAGGVPIVDFEMGTDLILFDDLRGLDPARALPLTRNQALRHPRTGTPLELVKYPGSLGFVPFGARRGDGTPHPHAGTGFCLSRTLGFPADHSVRRFQETPDPYSHLELQQWRYDGTRFRVTADQRPAEEGLLPGWDGWGSGMSTALPDGDDLLLALYGRRRGAAEPKMPLVVRWRRTDAGWRPVEASPVEDAAGASEPSLIRDRDGSLLLCARHGWPPSRTGEGARLQLWRSADGRAWERCLDLDGLRSPGPVVLARTLGGQPFIVGNGLNSGRHSRASLSLWPLNDARAGITQDSVVFDADDRFGPAPVYAWNADHPLGAVVRLGDGRLHSLEAIRVCETTEVVKDTLPTPATGCYIEEVLAEAVVEEFPVWA